MHYHYALYNAERVYTFDGVELSLLCLTIQDTWSLVSADEIPVATCFILSDHYHQVEDQKKK